jgi:inhibitor of cysteine peptidase
MLEDEMGMGATVRVATAVAVLAAAVAAGGLLAGCGTSEGEAPKTIEVTPAAQTGTTVDAAVGDLVVVNLEANATTGYEWQFTAGDTFVIDGSKYVPSPAPSNVVGSGGTQVVTLRITKAGSSDLTGTYRQPWVTPSPDAEPDFQMTIVSE